MGFVFLIFMVFLRQRALSANNFPNFVTLVSQKGLDFAARFAEEKSHVALQSLRSKDSYESRVLFSLIKVKVENVVMPYITKPDIALKLHEGYGVSADVKVAHGRFGFNLETTLTSGTVVGEFRNLHIWFYVVFDEVQGGLPVLKMGNCQVSLRSLAIDSSSTFMDILTDMATSDASRKRQAYSSICLGLKTAVQTINKDLTKSSLTDVRDIDMNSTKFLNMSGFGYCVRMARKSLARRYFLSSYFFVQLFSENIPQDMGYEDWEFTTPNNFSKMMRVGVSQNLLAAAVTNVWVNRIQNLEYRVTNDDIPNWFGRVIRKMLCRGCEIVVTPTLGEPPAINVSGTVGIQVKMAFQFVVTQKDGGESELWARGRPTFHLQIVPSFDELNRLHLAVNWIRNDLNLSWSTEGWWSWAIAKLARLVGTTVEQEAQKQVESFVGGAGETLQLDKFLGTKGLTVPSGAGVRLSNSSVSTQNEMIIFDTDFILQ